VTGANMLEPVTYLHDVVPLVRWHQERYDGTGYPDGLAGETIPLENRILSVAEAFCAITSDRPHRPAASADEAVVEIKSQSGKQFDPLIVEHLAVVVL
jgi:putative two-component system response regulator